MAPALTDFPTEIIEKIADYLQLSNYEAVGRRKGVPIFNFRIANKQLAAKSERAFARMFFSDRPRVVHGIETEINRVVQLAKRSSLLTSYAKRVHLILWDIALPTVRPCQLDDPLVTQALNGFPNINGLDVRPFFVRERPGYYSKFSSDLYIPQLIELNISDIAVDPKNLAAFMMEHDNLRSVDLGSITVHSEYGSYTDILDSAYNLPRLRKFILNRSWGTSDWYDEDDLGDYSEDDYEFSLASSKATVVATEQVQMCDAIR
jgi:hypothetical protein